MAIKAREKIIRNPVVRYQGARTLKEKRADEVLEFPLRSSATTSNSCLPIAIPRSFAILLSENWLQAPPSKRWENWSRPAGVRFHLSSPEKVISMRPEDGVSVEFSSEGTIVWGASSSVFGRNTAGPLLVATQTCPSESS